MLPDAPTPSLSRRRFLGGLAGAAALAATIARGQAPNEAGLDLTALTPHDLPRLRDMFLLTPGLTYLNNGSLGPSPAPVPERAADAWRRLEANPAQQGYGPLLREAEAVRLHAARLLGCQPEEMVITHSTTDGMNLAAQGIRLDPGDRVLTTDHEHPGGALCWAWHARHRGLVIDKVALPVPANDPDEIVRRFEAAFTDRTRVVSASHVTFTTGARLPIPRLAALAHRHNALMVVDGAQAPGAIAVNFAELGCDAYATSAHKWLLAPKGTGLLYLAQAARSRIEPMRLASGPRVYTGAAGVTNLPAVIGLGAAIDLFQHVGIATIEAHNLALRARLIAQLANLPGIELASPADPDHGAPIVTIRLPAGTPAREVAAALAKQQIEVRVVNDHKLNALRVSLHLYNHEPDVRRFSAALSRALP